jgi:arylsulfatase A-like enzyme
MAAEGMSFTQAYSGSPVCSPSRAALFSGQYSARNKMTEGPEPTKNADILKAKLDFAGKNLDALPTRSPARRLCLHPDQITFAEVLQPAGYKTGYLGKWHCGWDEPFWPDKQGFEMAEGFRSVPAGTRGHWGRDYIPYLKKKPMRELTEDEYMADALTQRAVEFIEENSRQPFLLVLSHYLVHTPLQGKPEKVAKWKKKATTDQDNPVMAAMIESVDESVGRVMATLKRLGIDDNTVVIFTSDNGGHHRTTSTYPLMGSKAMPYEGGHRVPMIVRWPGKIDQSVENSTPTVQVDLYPTILDLTQTSPHPDQHLDGISLKKVLFENDIMGQRPIFFHFPHYSGVGCTPYSAVRYGDWKLYRYYNDGKGRNQLFNLKNDPYEQHDVAAKRAEKLKAMEQTLTSWLAETDGPLPFANPEYRENIDGGFDGMDTYEQSLKIRMKRQAKLK